MNGLMLYRQYLENIRECVSNYDLSELESKKFLDILSRVNDIEDLSYIDVILKNAGLDLSFISDREFLDKEVVLKSKIGEAMNYEDEDEEMQEALSEYLNDFVAEEDAIIEKLNKFDEVFGKGDLDRNIMPQSTSGIMGTTELLEKHKDTLSALFGALSGLTKDLDNSDEEEEDLESLEDMSTEEEIEEDEFDNIEGLSGIYGETSILENGESDEYAVSKEEPTRVEEVEGFRSSEKVTVFDTGVISVDMSDEYDDDEDLDLFEGEEVVNIRTFVKKEDTEDTSEELDKAEEQVISEDIEQLEAEEVDDVKETDELDGSLESKGIDSENSLDTSFLDEDNETENNNLDTSFLDDEPEYVMKDSEDYNSDDNDIEGYSFKNSDIDKYLDSDEEVEEVEDKKDKKDFNTDFLNEDYELEKSEEPDVTIINLDDEDSEIDDLPFIRNKNSNNYFSDDEDDDYEDIGTNRSMSSEDLNREVSNMYSLNEQEDTEPKEGNPFKEATDYFLNGGKRIKKDTSDDLRKLYKSKERLVDVDGIGGTEDALAKMIMAASDGLMNLPGFMGKLKNNSKKVYDKMVVEEDDDEE